MASQQSKVFLTKINTAIKKGDYDKNLTIPFMSKELLAAAIKSRVLGKEAKGGNPILTDSEIKECINDAKETAMYSALILFNNGFLQKNEKGQLEVTKLGELAIKQTSFNLISN